jgi:epoxide hydrolase-like predicted phosphatase
MESFGERLFAHLHPNGRMIDYMRSLRARGYKLAICTNNVREWEARWRAMLPVDEIFDVVVDSAFVGTRKPEPEIYRLTLQRLEVGAQEALFIDDMELNCQGARDVGIAAVWFQSDEQAIDDIEALLTGSDQGVAA